MSIGKARYGHWNPSLSISVGRDKDEEFVKFIFNTEKEIF